MASPQGGVPQRQLGAMASAEPEPRAYRRLAGIIRERIMDGTVKPDDFVSITDLRTEFGVARQTAAKSLTILVEEGLLIRYTGYGYRVTRLPQGGTT
jgi:DNA-binding GntR family transcriptional regulator